MHQHHHNIYNASNPTTNSTNTLKIHNNNMSSSNNLTDPRFLVISSLFSLYGLFILGICLFSAGSFWKWIWKSLKNVGRKFGLLLSSSNADGGGAAGEPEEVMGADRGDEGTYYQLLSERSKKRIDTLRQLAIEKLLLNYSLTLEKENVVVQRQQITLEMDTKTTINSTDVVAITMISNDEGDSASNTVSIRSDIEEGFYSCCNDALSDHDLSDIDQGGDAKEVVVVECCNDHRVKDENEQENSDNDETSSYTHVLIPFPGVGLDGVCIETSHDELTSGDNNNSGNKRSNCECEVKRKWPFSTGKHSAKRKEEEDEADNNNNTDSTTIQPGNEEESAAVYKNNKLRRRQVPIFCSICLSEFDLSQQICWSSNTACTHVFHSDCMIQWLVALGRKHSSMKRFPWYPTEWQLVGHYELQCPCCRQEFIKSAVVEKTFCDGGGSSSTV